MLTPYHVRSWAKRIKKYQIQNELQALQAVMVVLALVNLKIQVGDWELGY